MVEPIEIQTLDIAVAQRYSFIVDAKPATNYWIRTNMDTFCFATINPVLNTQTSAILAYGNNPPPADNVFVIKFSFREGSYAIDRAFINGTSWTESPIPTLNRAVSQLKAGNVTVNLTGSVLSYDLSDQYIVDVPTKQVIDILVQNFDDGSHPFRLHGNEFYVLASSPDKNFQWEVSSRVLNTKNPMRRDTVIVESYGLVMLRVEANNPGIWPFHCHPAWHLAAGLLMQWQFRNDLMRAWQLPRDVLALCDP